MICCQPYHCCLARGTGLELLQNCVARSFGQGTLPDGWGLELLNSSTRLWCDPFWIRRLLKNFENGVDDTGVLSHRAFRDCLGEPAAYEEKSSRLEDLLVALLSRGCCKTGQLVGWDRRFLLLRYWPVVHFQCL